jgi:hypothetical protein
MVMKRLSVSAGCLLLLVGCGRAEFSAKDSAGSSVDQNSYVTTGLDESSLAPARAVDGETPPPAVERKIIYTGSVSLVAADLDQAKERIESLLADAGGYVDQFQQYRVNYYQRQGHWVVRVPSERFHDFLDDVNTLGDSESQQLQAQEVSEQYYDLEQRLANARRVEQEMLEIMEQQSGKMADVLEATKTLGEVRQQIETLDGSLRRMKHQVAMSTVTIDIREEADYIPPQAATFGGAIGNTFQKSLAALRAFGEGLVLVVVAVAPWLLVLVAIVAPLVLIIRFATRRRARA